MNKDKHFIALENMYLAEPINTIYKPQINVSEGRSEIEIELNKGYFHAAGAVHGSVYFKMLDDAAFFCRKFTREKSLCINNIIYNISDATCFFRNHAGGWQSCT